MLPHKDHKGHIGNPADPGIANQLRIKRKQAIGSFGVPAGRGLPINQAVLAIELSDGIDIGDKFIAPRQCSSDA